MSPEVTKRLPTCGGHSQNVTPVARPTNVHSPHGDEVMASLLQLDYTLTSGHTYYRSNQYDKADITSCYALRNVLNHCMLPVAQQVKTASLEDGLGQRLQKWFRFIA